MDIIDNISLSKVRKGIALNISYSGNEKDAADVTNVLLERYEVPKNNEHLKGLKDVIYYQTVLQYIGMSTANMSGLFGFGGGDIAIEPDIIDITSAWEGLYPKIVDSEVDIENNMYLYRILTYATYDFEYATEYVAGITEHLPEFYNPDIPDGEYIKFLDSKDIESIFPDNIEGIKRWIQNRSFFHDTYRLRYKGEHESFKFSTYWQRAWMGLQFINNIADSNDTLLDSVEGDINEFYT